MAIKMYSLVLFLFFGNHEIDMKFSPLLSSVISIIELLTICLRGLIPLSLGPIHYWNDVA